jgi:hypothetical protein
VTSLPDDVVGDLLAGADVGAGDVDRGDRGGARPWQPVHTLYVPADRCSVGTVADQGDEALRLLQRHAEDARTLAIPFELDRRVAERVYPRVVDKLRREPVEDLRVDFEDGYGDHGDADEDRDATAAGRAAAAIVAGDRAPRRVGLRVKSFADAWHRRAVVTADRFLTALVDAAEGLPDAEVVVTFPKVVAGADVAAFAGALDRWEAAVGVADGSVGLELQVETPSAIVASDGRVPLRSFVAAGEGRVTAVHFGVYDYTAGLGLPAAGQRLDHPACDAARATMQVALAGTGVELSDGSTIASPADDETPTVHDAWRRHAADVRHSLARGWWQGWDLHPAHLASRFVTVHAFHLAVLDDHAERVAAWATGTPTPSGVLDEPATVRVLLAQLRRAVDSGAVDEAGLLDRCQVSAALLRGDATP